MGREAAKKKRARKVVNMVVNIVLTQEIGDALWVLLSSLTQNKIVVERWRGGKRSRKEGRRSRV